MQDGGQDLVNSLNLIPCETDHFHGVGYSFEIGPVVDGRLQRDKKVQADYSCLNLDILHLFCVFSSSNYCSQGIEFPQLIKLQTGARL